jgi:hypothetical protein
MEIGNRNLNIVLDNKKNGFYIATIKKVDGQFLAVAKTVTSGGKFVCACDPFPFSNLKEAETKVKELIKVKIKRRGWIPVDISDIPNPVLKFLEVPSHMQMTEDEMIIFFRGKKFERYIVFKNVKGMEDYFDAGVEYLGYIELGNSGIYKVYDRFSVLRNCSVDRFASVTPTEYSEVFKGMDFK